MHLKSISLLLSTTLSGLGAASNFDCAHIEVDNYNYDLSPLRGVHEIYHVNETEAAVTNTTYVLNICSILGSKAADRGEDGKCGLSKRSTSSCPGRSTPPKPFERSVCRRSTREQIRATRESKDHPSPSEP